MPTLLEPAGRLLLHLREADGSLTAEELALRTAGPVQAELEAHLAAGLIREVQPTTGLIRAGLSSGSIQETQPATARIGFDPARYETVPARRGEIDSWLAEELRRLGREGRLYFAYGSNMEPEQMYRSAGARIPSARFLCRAELPGFMLAFPRRSERYGAHVAGLAPAAGGRGLPGVLYLMEPETITLLDRFEGCPDRYVRLIRAVEVCLAGSADPIEPLAFVYLHNEDGSGGGPPAGAYIARIRRGAAAFGLPAWYRELLDGIESIRGRDPGPERPSPEQASAPVPVQAPRKSKWELLVEYLDRQDPAEVWLSFSEVEEILGLSLPEPATKEPVWWASTTMNAGVRAWLQAGWKAIPDLEDGIVTFRQHQDEAPLFQVVSQDLDTEQIECFFRLYNWANQHGQIIPERGRVAGYTFAPSGINRSIFSLHVNGNIAIHIGWLWRSFPLVKVEALRLRLKDLPGATGIDKPLHPSEDHQGALPLSTLRSPQHWKTFTSAVLNLTAR